MTCSAYARWARGGSLLAGLLGMTLMGVQPAAADAAEQVQSLVERAAARILEVGHEQAFIEFSRFDGGFVDGDLYVFCSTSDGTITAHGGNPRLIGKNLANVRDSEGNAPNAEINRIGQSQGKGWLEYLWPNPNVRRVERKIVYVLRIDERTVCGSGYYRPDVQ